MDTSASHGDDTVAPGTVVVETRTVRRPVGRIYWVSAVVVVVLLTMAVGVTRGHPLEQALKKDVLAALETAGHDDVRVSLDGRMVTANVTSNDDAEAVKAVVSSVDGVSAVTSMLVYASYAEARDCADLQAKLDKATAGQRIPFAWQSTRMTAAGESMMRQVAKILTACETAVVFVGGHTDSRTQHGSTLSLQRAELMTRMLRDLGVEKDRLQARGYGDQFPVDESDTPAGRARNQRGSIIVRSQ